MFIPQAEVLEYPEIVATGWSKVELSHTLKQLFNIVTVARRVDGVMSTVYRLPLDKKLQPPDEPTE
jgi:hypothetical protein